MKTFRDYLTEHALFLDSKSAFPTCDNVFKRQLNWNIHQYTSTNCMFGA